MSFKVCAGRPDSFRLTYDVLFILEKTVCHRKIRGISWLVKQWAFDDSSTLVWQTNTHQGLHGWGWIANSANSSWIKHQFSASLFKVSLRVSDSCLLKASVAACPVTGQPSRNCWIRPSHGSSPPALPALLRGEERGGRNSSFPSLVRGRACC